MNKIKEKKHNFTKESQESDFLKEAKKRTDGLANDILQSTHSFAKRVGYKA